MSYKDEELLRLRQQVEEFKKHRSSEKTIEEECRQSIHDPVVFITKIPVEFHTMSLVDGRVKMRCPKDFARLPQDISDQAFMMERKPQYVYENDYLPFGLSFMLTDIETDDEKTEIMFPYMLSTIKKLGPNVRILSTERKTIHNRTVRWVESIAQSLTEPGYRITFLFSLDNKMAIGNLVCPSVLMKRFKPIMEEMVETLQIVTDEFEEAAAQ